MFGRPASLPCGKFPYPLKLQFPFPMEIMKSLKAIKGASVKDGLAGGQGFLLGPDGEDPPGPVRHLLTLADDQPFSFLFGLLGLGYHYRLDIRPSDSVLALYHIRDGIPVFLHHFSTPLVPRTRISIDTFHSQVRIGLNGFQVMHAQIDSTLDARIGFAPLSPAGFRLPDCVRTPLCLPMLAWLCLGDGFSNARWRNRHFLSWPELVFGQREDWFNGCVAAGNSRRIIQLAWDFAPLCRNSSVLIATGSDDLIEGESYEDFENRLFTTVQALRSTGVQSIHVATLPPRVSAMEETENWSKRIAIFADRHQLKLLDFHSWLKPHMHLMVRGEYPGSGAQKLLATKVADRLALSLPEPPPEHLCTTPSSGLSHRIMRKLHHQLDMQLADFPGVLR